MTRPLANPDDELFWTGAAGRALVVQRCAACGVLRHPPTPMCAACGSVDVEPHACAGRGHVLSWIFSDPPSGAPVEAEPDRPRRVVVLVELDEGLRIVSNLVDPPTAGPGVDTEVEVDFAEVDGAVLPVFRLTEAVDQSAGQSATRSATQSDQRS